MSKLILGIDVGKRELSLALLANQKFSYKTVSNNIEGFQKIVQFVRTKGDTAEVYLEATGRYGEAVTDFLFLRGFDVKVVNPIRIKAFSCLQMSRQKTDKTDAQLIAEFGGRSYTPIKANIKELRELYRTNCALKEQLTQTNNHLENKELLSESVRAIWEGLVEDLKQKIKIATQKIMQIITEDAELKAKFELLTDIPGIGSGTATAVLAEIARPEDFKTARKLAAYIGLTSQHRLSGSSVRGHPKISKMGLKILRKAFYMPAIVAMQRNLKLKKFAKTLRERGKKGKQIVCAVMRKLVHLIFGVLKYDFPKLALD